MKLYIAVLDEFPDYMVPTLVAHTMLRAHLLFTAYEDPEYKDWINNSFKKCVLRVNSKEFEKIKQIQHTCLGYENNTLDAKISCAIPLPRKQEDLPNVLKYAKLWKPKE